MEKREKIIVVMVVVAALYGVVDFTLTSHKKKSKSISPSSLPTMAAVASSELETLITADNKKIARIAVSINEPWTEHYFAKGPINFDGENKIDATREALLNELKAQISQLYYTGFVSMGDDRIAIINGMDYRIGEQIEDFTIMKITMDTVQVSASNAVFDIPALTEMSPPAASAYMPPKIEQN